MTIKIFLIVDNLWGLSSVGKMEPPSHEGHKGFFNFGFYS